MMNDIFDITGSIILIIGLYFVFKNSNTYKKRVNIRNAISEYNRAHLDDNLFSYKYFDMLEPYDKTLWRLYDWGYTRILPKEIFDKIKEFIKE